MKNIVRRIRTLEVPYESFIYLRELMHRERCEREYHPLGEKLKSRIKAQMPKSGMYVIHDGDFGGCNGDPHKAWEEGRWTSWSVDDVKTILDAVNLPYGTTGTTEVIDVYF